MKGARPLGSQLTHSQWGRAEARDDSGQWRHTPTSPPPNANRRNFAVSSSWPLSPAHPQLCRSSRLPRGRALSPSQCFSGALAGWDARQSGLRPIPLYFHFLFLGPAIRHILFSVLGGPLPPGTRSPTMRGASLRTSGIPPSQEETPDDPTTLAQRVLRQAARLYCTVLYIRAAHSCVRGVHALSQRGARGCLKKGVKNARNQDCISCACTLSWHSRITNNFSLDYITTYLFTYATSED